MRTFWILPVVLMVWSGWSGPLFAAGPADQRAEAKRQLGAGNFKVALDAYRQLVLDPNDDRLLVCEDLRGALAALTEGRVAVRV